METSKIFRITCSARVNIVLESTSPPKLVEPGFQPLPRPPVTPTLLRKVIFDARDLRSVQER